MGKKKELKKKQKAPEDTMSSEISSILEKLFIDHSQKSEMFMTVLFLNGLSNLIMIKASGEQEARLIASVFSGMIQEAVGEMIKIGIFDKEKFIQ